MFNDFFPDGSISILIAIIISIVAFVIIERIVKGLSSITTSGPSIAIKEFNIADSSNADILVKIKGRATGLIAWLLERLKLDTQFLLIVDRKGAYFEFSNITGRLKEFTPFSQIAGTSCGYTRNVFLLEISLLLTLIPLILFIGGVINFIWFVILFIFGVGLFFIYHKFSEKIVFFIESTGSISVWIRFSKGIIEGTELTLDDTMKAINIINERLQQIQSQKDKLNGMP